MTEEEIMIRAREAARKLIDRVAPSTFYTEPASRDRLEMAFNDILAADLSKPLSEIWPVDPDIEEAWRVIVKAKLEYDDELTDAEAWQDTKAGTLEFDITLAAIKRGRELERDQ